MGADGNGDRRQSLVRLFFLFFFRSSSFEFPARIKIRGGERPTGPPTDSVSLDDVDVFLDNAAWAIRSTYHTVLKASPGAAIFG